MSVIDTIKYIDVIHLDDIDKGVINIGDTIMVHEVTMFETTYHDVMFVCIDKNEDTDDVTLVPCKGIELSNEDLEIYNQKYINARYPHLHLQHHT